MATLDPRHADPLQPNSPSCGTQPAHISLTARRQRHAHPRPTAPAATTEAPSGTHPDGASPCPLDRKPLHISCSSKTSAGVLQPRVLRGRLLIARATACRSSADHRERSVPLGKYWRSSPFVFSFVGRCQGECGSAKNTLVPVSSVNWACPASSLPRSQVRVLRAAGQRGHRGRQGCVHRYGAVTAERGTVFHGRVLAPALQPRQMHQERGSAAALDERADRRAVRADDQVAFRKTEAWPGRVGCG